MSYSDALLLMNDEWIDGRERTAPGNKSRQLDSCRKTAHCWPGAEVLGRHREQKKWRRDREGEGEDVAAHNSGVQRCECHKPVDPAGEAGNVQIVFSKFSIVSLFENFFVILLLHLSSRCKWFKCTFVWYGDGAGNTVEENSSVFSECASPSVLWHCWLGGRRGIRYVKKNGGMVEVSTGWSGWSGPQPDGRCLPLLVFPCTRKSRGFLLAAAHPGGPGKRAVKWWLCVCVLCGTVILNNVFSLFKYNFGSRPSDHYFRSVCLSVCLFVQRGLVVSRRI